MTSILYIPAEGDPHGILADGLCGARMPYVSFQGHKFTKTPIWQEGGRMCPIVALPLVWLGELVPEAIDRLIARTADHRWPHDGAANTAPRNSFVASSLLPNRDGYWWMRSGWVDRSDVFDLDVPESIPDAFTLPWALATIAVQELGGRVEVVP